MANINLMCKALLTFVLSTIITVAFGQTGSITGKITDSNTQEVIVGANVVIQGTTIGSATDVEGKFTISNVKPGTYNLAISFITYKTHIIPDVVVESAKISEINVAMLEDSQELQEVVVQGTREISTDFAMLSSIRDSKLVVSGISAQQMVRLPDKDVAQVAQRVPGITIVDNRFIMVRGIPERYNQVMINGAIAPSTEIEKRSFSFDLVPANALDQLLIYKSGTAELPGDFAGGVIQMVTKNASDEEYVSAGFSVGYRHGTTFKDYNQSKGSSTDFLGFDNGDRSLPSDFPSAVDLSGSSLDSKLRENAGKSLENTFGYSTKSAPIDFGFNFSIARNLNIGKVKASNLTSLGYSNSYQYANIEFNRYNEKREVANEDPKYQFRFIDQYNSKENKVNVVHNWQFNIGQRSKIEFKNLFVQIGENQTWLRSGVNEIEQAGKIQNNAAYRYLSRMIYTGQLRGVFKSANEANTYSVSFGANYIDRNEPDYRRYRRVKDGEADDTFEMILPTSSSTTDAGRFYSNLIDKGFSHSFNYEKKFGDVTNKRTALVKAGYYLEQKTRDFEARYVSYSFPGTFNTDPQPYIELPLNEIFNEENLFSNQASDVNFKPGFALQEVSRPENRYSGENLYTAAYVSSSLPAGKFDISAGFRLEYNVQKLSTQNDLQAIEVDNPVTSPLPFLNVAYNLSERSLIRTAYSRTVNRPEFRELSPFGYYQFELDANAYGNPDLKTATINNVDLRWEMYPNTGEMISVGGFYKTFKNPIEMVLVNIGGLGQNFNYKNAPEAYSYGVELEVKKSLASLSVAQFFHNTTVNLNASWIQSQVTVDDLTGFQRNKRNLQGQSPYVINAAVYYADENGLSANVAYNIFGKRILAVGSTILPSWWEMPRNTLDVQVSKAFGKTELKLSVSNLLNSKYRTYQDDNDDQKIESDIDQSVRGYKTGQLISLSVNWKFTKD